MTRARISVVAARPPRRRGRARRARTRPTAPRRSASRSAPRTGPPGSRAAAIRYTHQACRFGPVGDRARRAGPGRRRTSANPPAPAGGPRAGRLHHPGRSPAGSPRLPTTWPPRPDRRPRQAGPAPAAPSGNSATPAHPGWLDQARCEPGAPGCLPCPREPSARRRGLGFRAAGPRPGWAPSTAGTDELPLLRDTSRSSRSTLACSSAIAACCSPIAASCAAITTSRATHAGHPAGGSSDLVTSHHHQDNQNVIKPTRTALLLNHLNAYCSVITNGSKWGQQMTETREDLR